MSQPFRAPAPAGTRIDRAERLRFTFDGVAYEGYRGDTLASALLANGVRRVARSFKYHRPRGIYAGGAEEPNALVRLGSGARAEPNSRATQVELFDGLVAESQNRWPSLALDRLGGVHLAWAVIDEDPVPYPDAFSGRYAVLARPHDGVDQNCDGVDGVDADGDGHASVATGGDDVDDADPGLH